jgi:hypothetical protein
MGRVFHDPESHRNQPSQSISHVGGVNSGVPIHNGELAGYLKALYMLMGDVKGGGPFPPIYGGLEVPHTGVPTSSDQTVLESLASLVNSPHFLSDLAAEAARTGANPNIVALNKAFNEPFAYADGTHGTLAALFQGGWTYGTPAWSHLVNQLNEGSSPLCSMVKLINTGFNAAEEKSYSPPDCTNDLVSYFDYLSQNLQSKNADGVMQQIGNILGILNNPQYQNDGFVLALKGMFNEWTFNNTGNISGSSGSYTHEYSLQQLFTLANQHPDDKTLEQNIMAVFGQSVLPGGGSTNPGDPDGSWLQMFTNSANGQTGIGNFLNWYMAGNQ